MFEEEIYSGTEWTWKIVVRDRSEIPICDCDKNCSELWPKEQN